MKKTVKKTPKKTVKNKKGRPTKYEKKYCKDIVEYFDKVPYKVEERETKKGLTHLLYTSCMFPTIEGFCAEIEINKSTLHERVKKYKDFSNAYEKAKQLQKKILIINGLAGVYNSGFAKFICGSELGMQDVTKIEHEGEFKIEIVNYKDSKDKDGSEGGVIYND